MKSFDGCIYFSATDLSGFLGCPHLTVLSREVAEDRLPKPPRYDDPRLEVLQQRGLDHEAAWRAQREAEGKQVAEIPKPDYELGWQPAWEREAADTRAAVQAGSDIIYQAAFFDPPWYGLADFLIRVDRPSDLGNYSYEVVDAKLAREAKGTALLQILLYSDLLARVQGRSPENVHLALGGPEPRDESFRVKDYDAYFRSVRGRFLAHVEHAGTRALEAPAWPVAHCDLCDWRKRCEQEWRDVDHLSFVAGIQRRQADSMRTIEVATLTQLATHDIGVKPKLDGVGAHALMRVREQARIQLEGKKLERTIHELLQPIVPEAGLAALPEPSEGDIFFDIEGDPFAYRYGLDYLFGWTDRAGNYESLEGLTPDDEKAIFERFLDVVKARRERWPDMHVYHYAPYEPTALKRLMGRHATREADVDALLRGKVLVDLYRVVRQALRASVESYSIKKLEPLYGFTRATDLPDANRALAYFEAWLESESRDDTGPQLLETIEAYNKDDCVSTLRLRDWLESQRAELIRGGLDVPRPSPRVDEPKQSQIEDDAEVERLTGLLAGDVPADEAARTPGQQARWLLAQTLSFHRREDKSTWWQYFDWKSLVGDDFIEDTSTMGGLEYVSIVDTVKKSYVHRYRFPPQDHKIDVGTKVEDPVNGGSHGAVWAIDESEGWIDLKRGQKSELPHPPALMPFDYIPNEVMRGSLKRLAVVIAHEGMETTTTRRAAADLLLRRAPRCGQADGARLVGEGEDSVVAARRMAASLEASMLAIQGPPGSGKTYTGARMVVELLRAGKRVGVTANSHKVIGNFVTAVCKAAQEEGLEFRGVQAGREGDACDDECITVTDNDGLKDLLHSREYTLFGGTAWVWAHEDTADTVDVLFIDEAGQFSLANALAVSQAGRSLVLLGDPAQLDQPLKGTHPPGSEKSALEHFLGGAPTMPAEQGMFLDRTWRLHPDVCAFTSELYYDERLHPIDGLDAQRIGGDDELAGAGLRWVAVEHARNQSDSPEEADAVAALVERLLAGERTWVDRHGVARALTLDDILIVAPYNAQVSAIRHRLPDGARVGTVDKFQGQEAPVVIYSTASSSADDAPRGMKFLYSPNRLNVATSRAKCLAIIVASPALFAPDCKTPEQMRLANGFCRFAELAGSPGS